MSNLREREQALREAEARAGLPAGTLAELAARGEEAAYTLGEVVCRAGEARTGLYLVVAGRARVVAEIDGEERTQRVATPGEFFGEECLEEDARGEATVRAAEALTVLRLPREAVRALFDAHPAARARLASRPAPPSVVPSRSETVESPPAVLSAPAGEGARPRRLRGRPIVMQADESDCGAACLSMILRCFGKQVSISRLRELANVDREGASLHSLAEAAEAMGFDCRGLRASYDHLPTIETPAIAHWEGVHYVVLYEARADGAVIADPAIGLRRLTRAEFEKGWTGYLLLVEPTVRLAGVEESRTAFGRFLPLLRPHRAVLIEIGIATLLLQFFGLALPIFTQVIVDKALVQGSASMLNVLLLGMLAVAVFQSATAALRSYLLAHTTRRIDMRMVVDFHRHILRLPMRYFEERRIGEIIKRFNENANVREFLTGRALGVILDCGTIAVYLGLMLHYNAKLALAAFVFMPGYAALTLALTPTLKRRNNEVFRLGAEADSQMVESVAGVGTIKATAAERATQWKMEGLLARALNAEFRSAMTGMLAITLGGVLQALNTIVLFWYGARLVLAGGLSVGQLVAFNMLVVSVTRPILGLIDLWREFQEVNVALERLNDVFDAAPEETDAAAAAIRLPRLEGRIRFDNVTFRYASRADRNALQNISLEIAPGERVAIVGRSGAGKSTLGGLLLRLHEPTEGRILIDGHDLRHVSLASLRAQIGVVPQDVFLFSGTIRENIALADPDAPLRDVIDAARLAGAHEFISDLPLGYETRVGERGQSLSGGQRQRLAIARALFRKPRILLFDEATSALDAESERAIQRNLDDILDDRTTLIIAHRLSTVRNADRILVLDQGVLVESGDHASLMQARGLYFHLHGQQLDGA